MGAATFSTYGFGANVGEAFHRAQEYAAWEHGHGGYTGTIAEKPSAVLVQLPPRVTAHKFLAWLNAFEDASYLDEHREDLKRLTTQRAAPGHAARKRAFVSSLKQTIREAERAMQKIPAQHRALVERYAPTYNDKWGPCLAFELTGAEAKRARAWSNQSWKRGDKAYLFAGWASC